MAKVQLSGSEKRALVLWVLAGIVGLWYAQRHFFEAFPEASVHFKVTREEALERAKKFVGSVGHDVSGYRTAIVFGVDDNAKVFLERQAGLKEANRLMSSEVNVWNWNIRFFKPQQEEEFRVAVSPEGAITGYVHKVPEATSGGDPTREAAQKTAQDFLISKFGKPASDWDFLSEEANSEKKPNRTDWSFTWERHAFRAKDAPERLQVKLQGEDIGEAHEALRVPEQWQRDYEHLRSTNVFYNQIAVIPYLLVFGACLWTGIQLTRKEKTNWTLALQLGVLTAIFLTAMQLNRWPLDLYGYNTNSAFGSFTIQQVLGAVLFGAASALTVTLVLPGAEPLYREFKPQFLRVRSAFTMRGIRTKEFFSAAIVGLSMAAAHMGFLVAFYILANKWGAWAPQEMNYEDSVSTAIPWISGVAIGILAATSEEFLFRLFAIPFLRKWTKSNVIAVLLPAFSWGFLHTAYPNEPPYIRGVEVGLIGIVAGIVMLRWGILATLVWHYTVDASLVGLLLIRSSSPYFRISGVVIGLAVLIPFGIAVYSRLERGTFAEDTDLLNSAPDPEEGGSHTTAAEEAPLAGVAASETAGTSGYSPLTSGALALLGVCLVLGGLAALKLKQAHLGDYLKLAVSAKEATGKASEILRQRGVDLEKYHSATILVDVTDGLASEFLREKIGVPALNEIYQKRIPGALWRIRYFQDGAAEENSVILRPDGSLHSIHHDLADEAKGAALNKEEALERAQEYLRSEKNIDLAKWKVVEATSEKKPNRLDHTLIWQETVTLDTGKEVPAGEAENHAFARMQLLMVGDEPTSYRTFVKIPEKWQRQHSEQSVGRTVLSLLLPLFSVGLAGTALVFFLREIKSELMRAVPWRRFAIWALYGVAAYVLVTTFGDRIAQTMSQYRTAIPLKFMQGGLGIAFIVGAFLYLGVLLLVFAMAWFFMRQAFARSEVPGWSGMTREYYRDALVIGLSGVGALAGLSRATEWASAHWPTAKQSFAAGFGLDFDTTVPAIAIAAAAIFRGLLLTGAIAAVASFIAAHCKSPVLRAALFLLGSLALVGNWGSPADLAKQWIARAIFLAVVVFGVTRIARFNLLGYFLVLATSAMLSGSVEMLTQPNAFYRQQGWICVLALAVPLLWTAAKWIRTPEQKLAA